MSINRDLPFSQWRLRPEPGEPSYGYFARLVAEEGHSSTKIYATEIGINGRSFVPEEMLHVLQRLPLAASEHDRLRDATPLIRDGIYHIGQERLRPKQLSFRHRRFCPHCLADGPYHRVQWDIVVASHCSIHGTRLVDEVDGKKFGWWWPHFDVSPEGENLSDRRPVKAEISLPFHEMLRSRLELGEREEGPMAEFELFEIIEPARFFGRYSRAGNFVHPRDNPAGDIEAGFALLTIPHSERVSWFAAWYETVINPQTRRRGYAASTPSVAKINGGRADNRLWEALEQAQQEGFARVGTLGRKRTRRRLDRSDRTLIEASRELKVPPKALSKFIRKLGLLPDAKWNGDALSIDPATFQTLKATIDDLITLPETVEITGIPGHEFRPVAKAGFIQEFTELPINGVGGPKYRESEVHIIVERLRSIAKATPTAAMKTLLGYARTTGLRVDELLVMTLTKAIAPSGFDPTRGGLRALYFQ
ncbi:TniQ family protein [Rhizobium leguminosarum]|uniref:TniQ family protein n=1 Tax=Rhizobium leguminosarum TaxID=384 RepID=UPI001C93FC26|nr:TniQ family protein [Rhizobium leguminosarum]MBY5357242.1 TniQ family protein [Rhizobium leguminosarum]